MEIEQTGVPSCSSNIKQKMVDIYEAEDLLQKLFLKSMFLRLYSHNIVNTDSFTFKYLCFLMLIII